LNIEGLRIIDEKMRGILKINDDYKSNLEFTCNDSVVAMGNNFRA